MVRKHDLLFIICFTFVASCTSYSGSDHTSQENSLPFSSINLHSLSGFQETTSNGWKIAGNVYSDRKELHHMEIADGTGILAFQPEESDTSDLLTRLRHGDIDLQLDFMMAKGSSVAILLQGRYEVRLADSWQKDEIDFIDCGGIVLPESERGFEGEVPAENAARAPGLWQHLEVNFKAPRFDESRNKIADARFESITLNGKVIQKNVTVNSPSASAAFREERSRGPVIIRSVQGPAAFRNIQYKKYSDLRIKLKDVQFRAFEGRFKNYDTLRYLTPVNTGMVDSLTFEKGVKDGLLEYKGLMQVPRSGEYMFRLSTGGASWFYIDSGFFMDNKESRDYEYSTYATKYLEKGQHTFRLIYLNTDHSLVLHYEGPAIPWTPLNKASSVRRRAGSKPMHNYAEDEPVLLRSFFMHKDRKMLHTLSLGLPEGLNYAYSLRNYAPLTLWRGGFANVAQMWRFRGREQILEPLGVSVELNGKPAIAFLSNKKEVWPDTATIDFYTDRKYQLNDNRLPVFFYSLEDIQVQDHLSPTEDGSGLRRRLSLNFSETSGADKKLYILLASAPVIEQLSNGDYAVNDKNYYIEEIHTSGRHPFIRESKEQQQLILPVTARQHDTYDASYTMVW